MNSYIYSLKFVNNIIRIFYFAKKKIEIFKLINLKIRIFYFAKKKLKFLNLSIQKLEFFILQKKIEILKTYTILTQYIIMLRLKKINLVGMVINSNKCALCNEQLSNKYEEVDNKKFHKTCLDSLSNHNKTK